LSPLAIRRLQTGGASLPRRRGVHVGLIQKDLDLCLGSAHRLSVPVLAASAGDQLFTLARGAAGDDADLLFVVEALRLAARDGDNIEIRKEALA
jgi:3-hydroxyisobutyrate dehydrogenase-like beta-hydroxyacid dehydrogenase